MAEPVLFRGATAVRAAVIAYLTAKVPLTIEQARTDWNLTEYQLPKPVAYDAYEPYALDQWPLIGVNVAQAGRFNRVGYNPDMSQRYLAEYNIRVYTWVRTAVDENEAPLEPEYSEALRLRDDLAACVRAVLLRSISLGNPAILFDESSLTEDYSEATKVKGGRFVAGVAHAFTLRYDETAALIEDKMLGTANTIRLQVRPRISSDSQYDEGMPYDNPRPYDAVD